MQLRTYIYLFIVLLLKWGGLLLKLLLEIIISTFALYKGFKYLLCFFGLHRWKYEVVTSEVSFDCDDHNHLNKEWEYVNRECKCCGKLQCKLAVTMGGNLDKGWSDGNVINGSKHKSKIAWCAKCNKKD